MDSATIGKLFLGLGISMVILGGLFLVAGRVPILSNFGKLPGDIRVQKGNFACFAPMLSMCLLSVIATIVLNVIARVLAR